MNVLSELNKDNGREVSRYLLKNPSEFDNLIRYFFEESDIRLVQLISTPLLFCAEKRSNILDKHYPLLLSKLKDSPNSAVKRNSIRFLQFTEIPEEYMGEIADLCFSYLSDTKEAVAVRAFSMTVLFNISKQFPELQQELYHTIEDHLPYGSTGFKNRGDKVLKQIEALLKNRR
ncbi:MAG: hypothetical protein AB8B61_08310 [Cyclobacteriaceae bacterium]